MSSSSSLPFPGSPFYLSFGTRSLSLYSSKGLNARKQKMISALEKTCGLQPTTRTKHMEVEEVSDRGG